MKFFKQLNVGLFSYVGYQRCVKYCDDRAHQNSAFVLHEGTESYGNFGEFHPAARAARQSLTHRVVRACELGTSLRG
jgi:hypothetical protein